MFMAIDDMAARGDEITHDTLRAKAQQVLDLRSNEMVIPAKLNVHLIKDNLNFYKLNLKAFPSGESDANLYKELQAVLRPLGYIMMCVTHFALMSRYQSYY